MFRLIKMTDVEFVMGERGRKLILFRDYKFYRDRKVQAGWLKKFIKQKVTLWIFKKFGYSFCMQLKAHSNLNKKMMWVQLPLSRGFKMGAINTPLDRGGNFVRVQFTHSNWGGN